MPQQQEPLPDFDKLWDYSQPAETEQKFREILPQAEAFGDASYLAKLLTQIARAQGLQAHFKEAHTTLDGVEKMLTPQMTLAKVRYCLERGRVCNSSSGGEQDRVRAMAMFATAADLAKVEKLNRYAIDAIHMSAIAETDPAKQVEYNLIGIKMVEADPTQRGWLWPLYNNIAESYALLHDYQSSLNYVEKLLTFQKERGEPEPYTLKDKARFLRLLGHPDKALEIIQPLVDGKPKDGWFQEEFAEALHALGRSDEAKPRFVKAYQMLSRDEWCVKHDPAKLQRLRHMAQLDDGK
jgi:tetratricopeptide (TPR) repeat protein